ncbi:YecA family protein [Sphingomonas koreensis]
MAESTPVGDRAGENDSPDGQAGLTMLDAKQLSRIESVHRGFLYQHLYAAICLLLAGPAGVNRIVVEGDEDVELQHGDGRFYVQVKTRVDVLTFSDIGEALARFATIRAEHASGSRQGSARFVIATNAAPGPKLADYIKTEAWPSDVQLHWPGGPAVDDPALPSPPAGVQAAIAACNALTGQLPFAMLRPETLTWKLAGLVMLAASGTPPRQNHNFERDELPALFEQLAVQMQDFPSPPANYRVQVDEPDLISGERIRIVAALSGAGKTAWVAEAATHLAAPAVYLDVGDMPGPALAAAIAREVTAKLLGRGHGTLGEILLPGASGLDTLGALSAKLGEQGLVADVVIDNAHRLPAADLKPIVDRAPNVRFVFLCQPGTETQELASLLNVEIETLGGWDEDTIAAAVADAGCAADFADSERLSRLTGGLPFYVLNAAAIARREYDGSIARLCADVEAQTHLVATAQEIILRRAFETLPDRTREVVSVLSLADVPLSRKEAVQLLVGACRLTPQEATTAIRRLPESGTVELFSNAGIKVHDAVRMLGRAHIAEQGADREREIRGILRDAIIRSLQEDWSIGRVALLVRLLGQLGEVQILVQFATDEIFHEMGVWREIEPFLVVIAQDPEEKAENRFWALDGLVFNDLREGEVERATPWIDAMRTLLDEEDLGPDEWLAWGMKRMLALSQTGDEAAVNAMLAEVEARLPRSGAHQRIFRYNRAHAMFKLGAYARTLEETEQLGEEYYGLLELTPADIFARNPDTIRPMLPKGRDNTDDLKHLADVLDLHAQALQKSGRLSPFARIHAMKFYDLARAPQSVVRVGQDLVEDFLEKHDYTGARDVVEKTLLPTVQSLGLVSWVVPVRAQYAVVLAYDGDLAGADREMRRLAPYEQGLGEEGRRQLRHQRLRVSEIRRFGAPPQARVEFTPQMQALLEARRGPRPVIERKTKVGRNEKCPCGSDRKFKHCHGR